jgi:hypothetical protein
MNDARPLCETAAALDAWYFDYVGRAAMMLKSRRDLLRVVDGDRRRFGERTPRPALDLKIIKKENEQ